jgi:hypothetical protein
MLRDYVYSQDASRIHRALAQFDVLLPPEKGAVALVSFQMLTPDSFVWRFRIGDAVYYLYAEDFVSGLDGVRAELESVISQSHNLTFIPVKKPGVFSNTQPFTSATVYEEPEDVENMMKFAAESGFDFVFLCRSDEDASDAFFN